MDNKIAEQLKAKFKNVAKSYSSPLKEEMDMLYSKFESLLNNFSSYPELEWNRKSDIVKKLSTCPAGGKIYLINKLPTDFVPDERGQNPFILTGYWKYDGIDGDNIVGEENIAMLLFKDKVELHIPDVVGDSFHNINQTECLITSERGNLLEVIDSSLRNVYSTDHISRYIRK